MPESQAMSTSRASRLPAAARKERRAGEIRPGIGRVYGVWREMFCLCLRRALLTICRGNFFAGTRDHRTPLRRLPAEAQVRGAQVHAGAGADSRWDRRDGWAL